MRIAINTHLLIYGKLDGIGWFTFETIKRLTHNHPEHEFILIFDRKPAPELRFPANTRIIVLPPPARHPILWFIRFEMLMPLLLRRLKPDVYLSPDGWVSLHSPVPYIQVIHDLNFKHNPKDVPFWPRWYYNTFFPRYAHKAARIATVSHFSAADIAKSYGIPPEKIDVTHNGCNEAYRPNSLQEQEATRKEYSGEHPYFIYVGGIIPRKNVARMLQAFDRFKKDDTTQTRLIIVGPEKCSDNNVNRVLNSMQFRDEVIFMGRKNTRELNALYSAATALVFVPYFEGFGIPILEAFNAETAVITSNRTSMPEVAGDAALLVDPFSVEDIATAMKKISTDKALRESLIEKAREQRKQFSWDNTAHKLWECIEKVVGK